VYLKFFGLAEKPFELTPNPKFLFLTPGHREALAQLTYGIQEEKGFILMTGEVGTGKTTLLRTLSDRMAGQIDTAFILNSTLPFDEILEYALADFGVPDPQGTRAQRLMALNRFLIEQRRASRKTILIIDEAQNLSIETLEQIRLLSNFETSTGKLIQIILSGQPELHAKLQLPQLRQLKQRIALRCVLQPMTVEEVEQYISNHLKMSGTSRRLFTPSAIRRISDYSSGIPRIVNMICDHCLLIGYAEQQPEIDAEIVKRAVAYLEEGESDGGGSVLVQSSRFRIRRYSRRVVVGLSAGVVAAAAATAGVMSPAAYGALANAMSTVMVASMGGFVRWLTTWWGS
jgi:type II secretory pathway predicted ATPase ExeA